MMVRKNNQDVGRAVCILKALRENLFPCLLQLLETTYIPWLMGSLFHLLSQQHMSSLFSDFQSPYDYFGPNLI